MNTQHVSTMADQMFELYVTRGFELGPQHRAPDVCRDIAPRTIPHYTMRGRPTGEAEYEFADGSVLVIRVQG